MVKKYTKSTNHRAFDFGKVLNLSGGRDIGRVAVCEVCRSGGKRFVRNGKIVKQVWRGAARLAAHPLARQPAHRPEGCLFCVRLCVQISWVQFSAMTQCFLWMKSCMSKHQIWLCSDCSQIYQSHWNKFMFSKQTELTTHTYTNKKKDT